MIHMLMFLFGMLVGFFVLCALGVIADDHCPKCYHLHIVPIGECGRCGWEPEG